MAPNRIARGLSSLLPLLVALPAGLLAQGVSTSGASGRITDTMDRPLDGVRVEMRDERTGATAVVLTDDQGRFFLPNLRPGGPYSLTAGKIGFESVELAPLSLSLGQVLRLDLVLREAAVDLPELEVRVETEPEFSPARMGASTLIDEATVTRLPTLSRNFIDFATLSPLVSLSEEGVSVAGANLRFNTIQVDGALNQDLFGLSPSGVAGGEANGRVVPLEAVEQFQVMVAPYDVRQSGFTGGLLNAVTKSGTNEWRGAGFGFYRSDALLGDLEIDDISQKPEDLDNLFFGLSLGGPIRPDRVHTFAAAEWERRRAPPVGFHVGRSDPVRTRLAPDSAARMEAILEGYGAESGTSGIYTVENQLANLFARFDVQLGEDHSGLLRYNFAGADDDPPANRLPGDAYEFSSVGTESKTRNHSLLFQLLSGLGDRLSNDLLVSLQLIRDETRPLADYSRVEVGVTSDLDGQLIQQQVRAGADLLAHANELDQDILQVVNNLNWVVGQHRLLAGASFQRFGIRRLFVPTSLGSYQFASLADLEANRPDRYDINVSRGATADPSVRFSVHEWSGYLQDEWTPTDWLNLRFGVRVDLPVIPSEPAFNPAAEEDFGIRTSEVPSGNPLFSPRFGFNIQLGPAPTTQIRGGAGLFAGRPPLAWLANAYQNTGLRTTFLSCEGDNAPPFDPTGPPPTACLDGTGPDAGTPIVNAFDPEFRFPQDFKVSLALDQRLPWGFIASLEGVYTRAVHQIFLEDLNLGEPIPAEERTDANGYTDGFGFGTREAFGPPTVTGFTPDRPSDRFAQVIRITNRESNWAYALAVELKRRFADRFQILAGYSYNRSADTQSLISGDATTNFGTTPIEGDPNDPKRQASLFDRPHKVVAAATARFLERLGGTEVTLLYTGQSGAPYSYVYGDDANGDGYPAGGAALDLANDLVYVNEIPSTFPDGLSGFLFEGLVLQEPCLEENRVRVLHRNACRAPWTDQLDFRLTQNIRVGSATVQVLFDLLNILNLLDSEWGRVQVVNPTVQALAFGGREASGVGGPVPTDPLRARYTGPLRRTEEGIGPDLPTVPVVPDSQWQAQLGLRISF